MRVDGVGQTVAVLALLVHVVGVDVGHVGELLGRAADGALPQRPLGGRLRLRTWWMFSGTFFKDGTNRREQHLLVPLLQLGRVLLVEAVGQRLERLERVVAVGGVDLVEVDAGALHLGVGAEGQLAETLELHDVHLGAQVFGQVAVDAEGDHAVGALERARVLRRRRAERQVHVDLVEVRHRALVLLQVALGAERHGARLAPERPLEVVDVDVQTQLRRLRKHLQQQLLSVSHPPLATESRPVAHPSLVG